MEKGTKVSFLVDPRAVSQRGKGEVIGKNDDGRWIVAIVSLDGGRPLGYKPLAIFDEKDLQDDSKAPAKKDNYLGHGTIVGQK